MLVLDLWVRVDIRVRVGVKIRDAYGTKLLGTKKLRYEMSRGENVDLADVGVTNEAEQSQLDR